MSGPAEQTHRGEQYRKAERTYRLVRWSRGVSTACSMACVLVIAVLQAYTLPAPHSHGKRHELEPWVLVPIGLLVVLSAVLAFLTARLARRFVRDAGTADVGATAGMLGVPPSGGRAGRSDRCLIGVLTRLLPQMGPADLPLLPDDAARRLYAWINHDVVIYHDDFVLAIVAFARRTQDTRALTRLRQYQDAQGLYRRLRPDVRARAAAAVAECLPVLQERFERERPEPGLLRPAEAPGSQAALLRPAAGPGAGVPPEQLLRAAETEEPPG